jgi:hypothetical protein
LRVFAFLAAFAAAGAAAQEIVTLPTRPVKGGKPAESGPCEPFAAHGFFGVEPQTIDAVTAWMLKKPFAKDIG